MVSWETIRLRFVIARLQTLARAGVRSATGRGTTFRVYLPAATVHPYELASAANDGA